MWQLNIDVGGGAVTSYQWQYKNAFDFMSFRLIILNGSFGICRTFTNDGLITK